jgi:hypothetical protein
LKASPGISDPRKTPFPWPGGKRHAAPNVWAALGDVPHYVEPFFGSGAVLLHRPHLANRTYYSETVNDADGLLVNFFRSVQLSPQETAEAASYPVTEADKHARACAVLKWRRDEELEHLMGDPSFHRKPPQETPGFSRGEELEGTGWTESLTHGTLFL